MIPIVTAEGEKHSPVNDSKTAFLFQSETDISIRFNYCSFNTNILY